MAKEILKVTDLTSKKPKIMGSFNNGPSGAIPLLCEAIKVFPGQTEILIETAQMLGELTWSQPEPEHRGTSLRKGASGKGYLLHCLFRTYKSLSE